MLKAWFYGLFMAQLGAALGPFCGCFIAQLRTVLGLVCGFFMASLWDVLWLICGLVWLWSLVRTKDVKNDMWVIKGKFYQNFLRPVSLFLAITWPTDLQIG